MLKEEKMIAVIVLFGLLCLVGTNNTTDSCEARLSFPSFAGQHSITSNEEGFGFWFDYFVDIVVGALVGPRGRWTSCLSSMFCRVSGHGLCCCNVFDYPQCVATYEECTTRIKGVDYYGYCLDPE